MSQIPPNSPLFVVPKTWLTSFGMEHLRQALVRSNLTEYFRTTHSHSNMELFGRPWDIQLLRAIGRDEKGETRWAAIGVFRGDEGRPGYLEAAHFLETALNAGVLIPKPTVEGVPVVYMTIQIEDCDVPIQPSWMGDAQKRLQEEKVRLAEEIKIAREKEDRARRERFEKRKSFKTFGEVVAATLEEYSDEQTFPPRTIEILRVIQLEQNERRRFQTIFQVSVYRIEPPEGRNNKFRLQSLRDVSQMFLPIEMEAAFSLESGTGKIDQNTFEQILTPLLNVPLGTPIQMSHELYPPFRPFRGLHISLPYRSGDIRHRIAIIGEGNEITNMSWKVESQFGEWMVEDVNFREIVGSIIPAFWDRCETQLDAPPPNAP